MKLPWSLRWWELAPEAVLGGVLVAFFVTETSAAASAFRSATAIGLMVGTAFAWLAGRILLVRYSRWPALRFAVFAIAAVGVLRVVVFPAYDDNTVVETLEVASAAGATSTSLPTTTAPAAAASPTFPIATPPTSAGPSGTEAVPQAQLPTGAGPPGSAAPPPTVSPTTIADQPAAPLAPPEPVAVRSAPIHGIDHRASGTAVLYRQPDGSLVVGLEGIDIQPGPDYDVYVVPGADQEGIGGGTRLDDLRGNQGTQYYPVPAGLDLAAGEWTVLVWCETFDVPVAGATPT